MKTIISILAVMISFSAHAEDAAVRAKAMKAIAENVAIQAILQRSAVEVQMDQKKCKSIVSVKAEADAFNGNKTVSGDVEINQICDNVEMDGFTNTTVKVMVSSSRALIESVEIKRSGF